MLRSYKNKTLHTLVGVLYVYCCFSSVYKLMTCERNNTGNAMKAWQEEVLCSYAPHLANSMRAACMHADRRPRTTTVQSSEQLAMCSSALSKLSSMTGPVCRLRRRTCKHTHLVDQQLR